MAGLHRLEAVRSLDWLEIDAVVVDLDDLQATLAEIDENLCRNELTTLERGEQLARRKAIYERLYPETSARSSERQSARRTGQPGETVSPGFSEDTATATGQTQRSIQQHVQIATAIPGDVRDAIRETPVADSTRELLTLARLEPEKQRAVAGASGLSQHRSRARVEMWHSPCGRDGRAHIFRRHGRRQNGDTVSPFSEDTAQQSRGGPLKMARRSRHFPKTPPRACRGVWCALHRSCVTSITAPRV